MVAPPPMLFFARANNLCTALIVLHIHGYRCRESFTPIENLAYIPPIAQP